MRAAVFAWLSAPSVREETEKKRRADLPAACLSYFFLAVFFVVVFFVPHFLPHDIDNHLLACTHIFTTRQLMV